MLVAGYETQFNDSIRYWRTRFVVIPTDDSPSIHTGPNGEELNDEEVRLLGIDKLAELFSKARWITPEDRGKAAPPIRFLTTDLDPAASILDDSLTSQLDEIHASGPLRKKSKNTRDIGDMSLAAIAKAMREEDGVPIKEHRWHGRRYANSFTGSDFVSWLVREFRDVSTREQGTEWGAKLQEQGLFEHCRGAHGFLDGCVYLRSYWSLTNSNLQSLLLYIAWRVPGSNGSHDSARRGLVPTLSPRIRRRAEWESHTLSGQCGEGLAGISQNEETINPQSEHGYRH